MLDIGGGMRSTVLSAVLVVYATSLCL